MGAPTSSADAGQQLLVCAAGVGPFPHRRESAQRLLEGAIDWPGLIRSARRHRVAAILHEFLNSSRVDGVPADVRRWLQRYRDETLRRSLRLTGHLTRILERFERDGVRSIPFKGPTLAALAYGELGLRDFFDLDLLVRRSDVRAASAALAGLDFRPQMALTPATEAAFLDTENALAFRRESDGCRVELHWALTPRYLPFLSDADRVWQSLIDTAPAGKRIATMAPDRLLLFLCVHGGKHCWENLSWIGDIARMIVNVPLDWDAVLDEAHRSGCRRMLLVGLLLAQDVLQAPLPAHVATAADGDRQASRLASEAIVHLAGDSKDSMGYGQRTLFHLKMRERTRDKMKYGLHVAFTPSVRDYETFRLPKYLSILYGPMRSIRLVREYTGRGKQA